MSKSIAVIVGILLVAVLLLFAMTSTVNFHEVAIRTRFGKVTADSIISTPGLKFHLPLADRVTTYDTRLQLRETTLDTVQTADGQQVIGRAFLLWRVNTKGDGPLQFFTNFPQGIDEANQSLIDQFRTALRTGLSRFRFDELIGPNSRLDAAEQSIQSELQHLVAKGIEPVTVGISQLVLPPKTTTAVLARMEATRKKLSEAERNRGDAEATSIQQRAIAQADKIKSFAEQRAADIRAAGDKDAEQFMTAMAKDGGEDLAVFLTWLDALQATLSQYTTVVLPATFAPFHMLNLAGATNASGIPIPAAEAQAPTRLEASDGRKEEPAKPHVPGGS